MRTLTCSVLVTFFFLGCATGSGKPWSVSTARYATRDGGLMLAATQADQCDEIGRKRIVKLAYLWPANQLQESDLKASDLPARRFRTEVTPGDIGFSLLGFMVGIVTETTVAEACQSPLVVVNASELARLRAAEQNAATASPETRQVAFSDRASSDSRAAFPELSLDLGKPRSTFTVYFAFASAQLSSTEEQRLMAIVGELKKSISGRKVLIVGHADHLGQQQWNDSLANLRARTIQDKLYRAGLDLKSLIPVSASANWPSGTASNSQLSTGAIIDRRVEIILVRDEK
ncbi:MAG: OmpA family protein [Leptospirales bacterium]|nr:OmpA family protein [Leptospirales bacterium]